VCVCDVSVVGSKQTLEDMSVAAMAHNCRERFLVLAFPLTQPEEGRKPLVQEAPFEEWLVRVQIGMYEGAVEQGPSTSEIVKRVDLLERVRKRPASAAGRQRWGALLRGTRLEQELMLIRWTASPS
jgi:hypothetical protein